MLSIQTPIQNCHNFMMIYHVHGYKQTKKSENYFHQESEIGIMKEYSSKHNLPKLFAKQ